MLLANNGLVECLPQAEVDGMELRGLLLLIGGHSELELSLLLEVEGARFGA